MLSGRKYSLNSPTSDKQEIDHLLKLKGMLSKAIGEPKDQKSAQTVLLKQLNNFHDYYGEKIEDSKKEVDRLRVTIRDLQRQYVEATQKLNEAMTELEIISKENQELIKIIEKGKQTQKLKPGDKILGPDIQTFYQSLNQSFKDKLSLIESKHLEEMQVLNNKFSMVSKEKQQLLKNFEKMSNDMAEMKLNIKEYEVQKKYESQRLKNATLQLQMKVKEQDQQIFRLKKQLVKQINNRNNTFRLSEIQKRDTMNDSAGGGILNSDPNCQSILSGSLLQQFKVTNKKIKNLGECRQNEVGMVTEKQKERKAQCPHKRNLSHHHNMENFQNQQTEKVKTSREIRHKGNSQLKIKVMRLQKMRRK